MFQFGIGGIFARPVGGNLGTPSYPQQFGVLQDVGVDLDQRLVALRGQNKFPDDVAPSDMTMKGKTAFARLDVDIYNSLFFADTVTTGIKKIVASEKGTVASNAFTVAGNGAGIYGVDLGVYYADGTGALKEVGSGSEAVGKYSVNANGAYTFAAGDNNKSLLFSYSMTDANNGKTLAVFNHVQGYGPVFELWLSMPYTGSNGMHIFSARASKMSAPMKRDGYLIADFEFEAFANAAGEVFEWFQAVV